MFNEKIFIWALCSRPEDAKRFHNVFKPEYLRASELAPLLAEIFAFTKGKGEPPSLATLHKIFEHKDSEAYKLRYKEVIESVEKEAPDHSEQIFTMDQAKDVAAVRSFLEMTNDPSFQKKQIDFSGADLIKDVHSWLSQFHRDSEDRTADLKKAVESLIQSTGFINDNVKIPCGVKPIDDWCGGGLRPKQLGILMAPSGYGKCVRKSAKLLMFSGHMRTAGEIKTGDLLMGPDSEPREVLGTYKGFGPMYKVTPLKGDPFFCNDEHVLSLKPVPNKDYFTDGKIVNIPLKDYLNLNKTQKSMLKLWRPGPIEWEEQYVQVDPYVVGAFLGDGTKIYPEITLGPKKDATRSYIKAWAEENDLEWSEYQLRLRIRGQDGFFRNFLGELLTESHERFIPEEYLITSVENRLQLLAGLLDTDGHLHDNCYEIACKDEVFKDQILFLARSLGFAAYYNTKVVKGTEYYRINISGDTNRIPCKVPTKQARPRKQLKNPLVTGFKVEYVGEEEHYGFELNKDHLFILEDFTVSHNSAMLLVMAHKMATVERKRVWLITNELSLEEVTERALSRLTGLPMDSIISDPIVAYKGLDRHWRDGLQNRFWVSDFNREVSTDEIESEMGKYANLYGWKPDVIVLDFMERMKPSLGGYKRDREWDWIGGVAKDLVRMAKRHNILVWTAAQTNRSGMSAKELEMSHAQGSIKHLQEASALIGMSQVEIPNTEEVAIKLFSLKQRHSKRAARPVVLKCDLSRMSVTNEEIDMEINEDLEVEQYEERNEEYEESPRKRQQKRNKRG